ncbi:MAG: GNAT family N-acetyltransferase [Chloroflexi bacterium]|nr:GNAT family N-acetyltransferase [Chloroflexota bacterium]
MDSTFTIQQATLADAPIIVAHRRRMFEDMGFDDTAILDAQEREFTGWLRERLENGRYRGWLAVNAAGEVVAGAGLWLLDWPPGPMGLAPFRGYILNVYTEPAYRKRGLARRLVQATIDWCHVQGIYAISLHASDEGRSVYESLGFAPTNEMRLMQPSGVTPAPSPSG